MKQNRWLLLVVFWLLWIACPAGATEIRVLSAGAIKPVLNEVIPAFERASGHKVVIEYAPAQPINKRVLAGETFDVLINSGEALDALAAAGKAPPATRRTLGVVGIGVAVKTGAPLPDIATEAAFRETLLKARSIAAMNPERSTSGKHFAAVLHQLGIADAVRPRLTLVDSGASAESVARGEAELAVQQISELLPVAGIVIVGPLPGALQKETAYAAVVPQGTADAAAAGQFIAYLASPEVRAVFRAKGFTAKE
jgi:molybdate transport system substrate-binding protein